MATTPSSDLDFDSIKQSLIDHMKSNPTFTDYNFQGSALSAIMDILALNTHTNAVLASMAHAENFIDSAQKRSSVVSRAKEMGYTPRSAVCSTATIDLIANGLAEAAFIARGTTFKSTNETGSYVFAVADTVASSSVDGGQKFSNVRLVAGTRATNSFTVNTSANIRTIFSIPNKEVDTSTLKVYYRESLNAVDRVELQLADAVYDQSASSRVYYLQESYDGFFQIYFGSNVIGFQPQNDSIIEIDYFVTTTFDAPNGCTLFYMNGTIGDASSVDITTTQVANSGAPRETIDSVKLNAKRSNSAKERSVAAPDFELATRELFPYVKAVSVWGGEENVPPVYGKVFISVQPVSGFTISETLKREEMVPLMRKKASMTVIPVFIDPEYLMVEFITQVKFNQSKTSTQQHILEGNIKNAIASHIESISTFNSDYIDSSLVSKLVTIDTGVVGVDLSKRVGFRVAPLIGVNTNYSRGIHNEIHRGTVKSTSFKILQSTTPVSVSISETGEYVENITTAGKEVVATLGAYTSTGELISRIGNVNLTTGYFNFDVKIHSYLTANRFVQISCELFNSDITSTRNQIVIMDTLTPEDTTIGLVSNNIVEVEYYSK